MDVELQAAGFVKQTECVKLSQEHQGYTSMYKKHRLLLFVQLPSARKSNKEERKTEFLPPSGFSTYALSLLFASAHHCISDIAPLFCWLCLLHSFCVPPP